MRFYTKVRVGGSSGVGFRLLDADGDLVPAFDRFYAVIQTRGFADATAKRYLEVVAGFLDYLTAMGVFHIAGTVAALNQAVELYIAVRARADEIRSGTITDGPLSRPQLRKVVEALGLRSVDVNPNLVAPVNMFLRLSETVAREEWERARHLGLDVPEVFDTLLRAFDGYARISPSEAKRLRQSSMLASVMRANPSGIRRPRGLSAKAHARRESQGETAFPLIHIADLLAAARTQRDRAFWSLLAGSGIRTCEALSRRWSNIDLDNQTVWVDDPNVAKNRLHGESRDRMRHKGRDGGETYLFQPLRTVFFEALLAYMRTEYIPGCGHEFVFQDIQPGNELGRPFATLSDTARNRSFKRAVRRAQIPPPSPNKEWGLHSLRHAYGTYMHNYLPHSGGYGLELKDVRLLMGHKSEKTTARYAKEEAMILSSKLEHADAVMSGDTTDLGSLSATIANRLRQEADRYERTGK